MALLGPTPDSLVSCVPNARSAVLTSSQALGDDSSQQMVHDAAGSPPWTSSGTSGSPTREPVLPAPSSPMADSANPLLPQLPRTETFLWLYPGCLNSIVSPFLPVLTSWTFSACSSKVRPSSSMGSFGPLCHWACRPLTLPGPKMPQPRLMLEPFGCCCPDCCFTVALVPAG